MSGTDKPVGEPLAEYGMTSQEIQLWYALAEVAGQFLQLPTLHPNERAETVVELHKLQTGCWPAPGFGPLAGQGTRSDELQNGRLRESPRATGRPLGALYQRGTRLTRLAARGGPSCTTRQALAILDRLLAWPLATWAPEVF